MRVSTKVEYGLVALADIALHSEDGGSVSALEISKREGISKKYLEQILPLLRQAGYIRAHKGLNGGYSMSCSAYDITLSDVINSLDNSILEKTDVSGKDAGELRYVINTCLWGRINSQLSQFAEGKTFAQFLQECRNQMSGNWDMYVI